MERHSPTHQYTFTTAGYSGIPLSAGESTLCIIGILLALMVALRSLYDAVTEKSPLCKAGNTWVCMATTYTAGHLIWLAIQYW